MAVTHTLRTVPGQLLLLNGCVCPGHELRLECTVVGGPIGITVWRGSAFDCNELLLLHSQFGGERAVGVCNDGAITGRGIRRVGLNFTSQLVVQLDINSTLEGRSVACVHDNGSHEIAIGTYTIVHTRGESTLHVK